MLLQEVVLCATASTGTSASPGAVYLHDIQTGLPLASFKQTSAGAHCTGIVQSTNDQGGLILSPQPDKAVLNVYNFQKVSILFSNDCMNLTHIVDRRIRLPCGLCFQNDCHASLSMSADNSVQGGPIMVEYICGRHVPALLLPHLGTTN